MRKRFRSLMIPFVVVALIFAACGDDDDEEATEDTQEEEGAEGQLENTGEVALLSAGEPEEVEAYQEIFDELIGSEVDYDVEIESAGNFEEQFQIRAEGGTLELAAAPQPGAIAALVESGALVSLEDMGFDIAELEDLLGASMEASVEVDGEHYGLPTNINLKSMVWYPKDDFDAKGYEVPTTFEELTALSDQIKADGSTPWCVGFGSEGSTGWPATDWIEDIVLRTAGADVYDQWVAHEIPFNAPPIKAAAETFGQVLFGEGNVLGGAAATPDIAFGDAPRPMFDNPPKCWLHRQASFINSFFPEDAEAGVDYDWFPFPPIDQEGILFGGELTVVGKNANRPEVKDFLERFISEEVQCEMGGVQLSSRISPNVDVAADCYHNDILSDAAEILTESLETGSGRFDASDLMPPPINGSAFWTGMVKYVRGGPDSLDGVLAEIEAAWPDD